MQPTFRVSLTVALAATSLLSIVPISVFAQAAKTEAQKTARIFSALGQAEFIDAAAKTVSIRRADLEPGQQFAENDLLLFQMAPSINANRVESAVAVEALRVGDIVSLLQPKSDASQSAASFQRPAYQWMHARRENFSTSRMRVISLAPLTLRSGILPDGVEIENGRKLVFHLGSYTNRIGTLWLGTGQEAITHHKSLKLNQKGEVTNLPTSSVTTHVATLQLTKTEGLEFNRYIPLDLTEVAAALAAENSYVLATLKPSPDGKQRVNSFFVVNKN